MNNPIQLLLVIIIITLTILIVLVAVQAVHVLVELRQIIRRVNGFLDAGKNIGDATAELRRFFKRDGSSLKK
ncbi:MAG: hypothetical protein Q8L51_01510 [Candidatus Amesbacteria bacterium]|nr:hypothetical protein [Candidatus Amesbacteria bacterium]